MESGTGAVRRYDVIHDSPYILAAAAQLHRNNEQHEIQEFEEQARLKQGTQQ